MKSILKLATLARALGMAGLTVSAIPVAMAADDTGWYAGGNVGRSEANIDDQGIIQGLQNNGFSTTSLLEDYRGLGFKLFGGYQFNRYFALEGGYFDLGKFGFTATTVPNGSLHNLTSFRGVNADLVGILPITEKFSAFGRLGVNYAKTSSSLTSTGLINIPDPSTNHSERNANYKFGVGLQYAVTPTLGLRAEAERYRVNDAAGSKGDIDLLSVGLLYRFGKSSPATAIAKAEPMVEPVKKTVLPVSKAPTRVVVPVAETQKYCSILDIQFEIDQDNIQREEKEKLGVVGTFMNKYPKTTAVIEGHSDNIGSAEHNNALSQKRADSVVTYLEDSHHIAANRLSAVGYGDSRPIADNNTEEGKRQNRRINAVIACATDVEGLKVAPARMTMALEMEFDKNKDAIRPEYSDELHKVAVFLKANPSTSATVEGHSGNADVELAQKISQDRAQNVVNYLVEKEGIDRSRLTAEGFGENRHFAYNTSKEGQQENRRVNIIINYKK